MLQGSLLLSAQKIEFIVKEIELPSEISYYDNQFSGLFIQKGKLIDEQSTIFCLSSAIAPSAPTTEEAEHR